MSIDELFEIKNFDIALHEIKFCDKIKLLTNCFANRKLKRLMTYGDRHLGVELDVSRIIKELRPLHHQNYLDQEHDMKEY